MPEEEKRGDGQSDKTSTSEDRSGKKRKLESSAPIDVPTTSAAGSSQEDLPTWVAGNSPVKFIVPDELLQMSIAMDNLALVHEIAVDPNFKVENAPKNPIEVAVKENMHRAYWDLLRNDLAQQPPVYTHAFNLLLEIKQEILTSILNDRHVRLRAEVNLILDENALRDKLADGNLDVKAVTMFVLELLGRLCCPERDSIIANLRQEENLVELIKGIFQLMETMKNDLANFAISQNRTVVEEHSAKLEYQTFLKYLEHVPDGSKLTREWLEKAYLEVFPPKDEPEPKRERDVVEEEEYTKSTTRGYINLARSENPVPFPETMRIDKGRLEALSEKFLQMTITTSAVLVTCHSAGREIAEQPGFKSTLKDHLVLITNDVNETNLKDVIDALILQCVKEVQEISARLNKEFTEEQEAALRSQLSGLTSEAHAVRTVVYNRLSNFVEEILRCPTGAPHPLGPGMSVIERELCAFTARLLRICAHNKKTFSELYKKMLAEIKTERETKEEATATTSTA